MQHIMKISALRLAAHYVKETIGQRLAELVYVCLFLRTNSAVMRIIVLGGHKTPMLDAALKKGEASFYTSLEHLEKLRLHNRCIRPLRSWFAPESGTA
eukprot:6209255-Pleurochrysis_carterae.AAC.2